MARLQLPQQSRGKSLPPGTVLKQYRINSTFKQGKYTITYLTQNLNTGGEVLIKEHMPAAIAHRNMSNLQVTPSAEGNIRTRFDASLADFRAKAEQLMQLNHPFIQPVIDRFDALGTAYYVLPTIPGQELRRAIPSPEHIDSPRLISLLRHILRALDYLHSRNVLHGNLTPDSIYLCADGTPRLSDFASANAAGTPPAIGKISTTAYQAPEQLSGQKCAETRSDFYALAATCCYLITGRDPEDTIQRMLDAEQTPPLHKRPDLQSKFSPDLLMSIEKGRALRADSRWQSAAEWLNSLPPMAALPPSPAELNNCTQPINIPARTEPGPPHPRLAQTIVVKPMPLRNRTAPLTPPAAKKDWYTAGCEQMLKNRLEEALQAFQQGHKEGNIDCTVQLALCYRDGIGTSIDFDSFMKLATELEQRGCAAAYCLLACAYADGLGCDVNINKADTYAIRWARESALPLPDMCEDSRLRLRALGLLGTGMEIRWQNQMEASHGRILPPIIAAEAMSEYIATNPAGKYQLMATQWLLQAGEQEKAPAELLAGLREEMQRGMPYSAGLLGMLLSRTPEPACMVESNQLLAQAAAQIAAPAFLWAALRRSSNATDIVRLREDLQQSLQFGCSHRPADHALPCRLYLQKPTIAGFIKVYNEKYVRELSNAELAQQTVTTRSAPGLKIVNTGSAPLQYLSLRIIQRGASQQEIPIQATIDVGQSLDIDLSDYQIDRHNSVRLELRSPDNRVAQLTPPPYIWQACLPVAPPILAYWEKPYVYTGNVILCLRSNGATLTNVRVHSSADSHSEPCTLTKNTKEQKIRKLSRGGTLVPRGEYIITLDEGDPMLCSIYTSLKDDDSGAWKTSTAIAKILLGRIPIPGL